MGSDPSKMREMRRAPSTDDERWSELLKRMAVPNHPGVYILGCFAQHVTFYSQQVRALNLVDALCKTGRLAGGDSIGVVGAGLAGLTVAAGVLRRGLRVHLFEKDADPHNSPGKMPLQTNSDERWVDPFIYDWPLHPDAADEERASNVRENEDPRPSANLPLLNWTANTASEVRNQVLEDFEKIVTTEQDGWGKKLIHFYKREVKEERISRDAEGQLLVQVDDGAPPIVVNALVLAVGFGVEDSAHTEDRYWTNDGLAGNQAEGKRYLVSGIGDGGLTDVMRLCIVQFNHRRVLSTFQNVKSIGAELKTAVREGNLNLGEIFLQAAERIDVSPEAIRNFLAERSTTVYLTGSPDRLFGAEAKASILNRLIVAWLLRKGRFKLVDARIRTPVSQEVPQIQVEFLHWDKEEPALCPAVWIFHDGRFKVTGEDPPRSFHRVIVRHGPGHVLRPSHTMKPLEEYFPTFWKESSENRHWWQEMPHWDDWTRRPTWEPNDFINPPPLDASNSAGPIYVVAEHPMTRGFVTRAVGTVQRRLHGGNGAPSPAKVINLDVRGEFHTPHRFGRAARALCRADVAVFDLTKEYQCPEALILLGIRSVARRSITLVTARFKDPEHEPAESDAPFAVPMLPFLLHRHLWVGARGEVHRALEKRH